ncbi:MAG: nickel pincer cofactor biosynthesis protein LarB [Firmicutes bacterium]|nr:nickel pincer cofactor biosynthesis protein LarB [Bacillota bacterium]
MSDRALERLLERFRAGETDIDSVIKYIRRLPYDDLGFAKVDYHRTVRQGFPEVIYCASKTTDQVKEIFARLAKQSDTVLATRANKEMAVAVKSIVPAAEYHEASRLITLGWKPTPESVAGEVAVVCAGTSDLPVAEEAAITAEIMGSRVTRVNDVGVAGLHRLFGELHRFEQARAVVVVAGMEGALASVVGGLIDKPVIAVPTSVGYGAAFGGIAALLGMLNSCAAGVSVVNIDNGFGAGYTAHLIAR